MVNFLLHLLILFWFLQKSWSDLTQSSAQSAGIDIFLILGEYQATDWMYSWIYLSRFRSGLSEYLTFCAFQIHNFFFFIIL